jgi:ubiquitin
VQLHIKTLVGKTFTVSVSAEFTIENVKSSIQSQSTIPINQQRLIYNGQQLVDNRTVYDYQIPDDSTLLLVLKP